MGEVLSIVLLIALVISARRAKERTQRLEERIERLEEEKKAVAEQIKEVFAEAKANGFDTKTLRKVVQLRKRSTEERQEEEALLDLYLHALGMLDGPPQAMMAAE